MSIDARSNTRAWSVKSVLFNNIILESWHVFGKIICERIDNILNFKYLFVLSLNIAYFLYRIDKWCLINIANFLSKSTFKFDTCLLDSLSPNNPLLLLFLWCMLLHIRICEVVRLIFMVAFFLKQWSILYLKRDRITEIENDCHFYIIWWFKGWCVPFYIRWTFY